jgi:hypothetical protein
MARFLIIGASFCANSAGEPARRCALTHAHTHTQIEDGPAYMFKTVIITIFQPLIFFNLMANTRSLSGYMYIYDFVCPWRKLEHAEVTFIKVYGLLNQYSMAWMIWCLIQFIDWLSSKYDLQVDDTESLFQVMLHSKKWGTLVFVIVEILFWGLVAGFLHLKGIYVRLWKYCRCCFSLCKTVNSTLWI